MQKLLQETKSYFGDESRFTEEEIDEITKKRIEIESWLDSLEDKKLKLFIQEMLTIISLIKKENQQLHRDQILGDSILSNFHKMITMLYEDLKTQKFVLETICEHLNIKKINKKNDNKGK